MVEQRSFAIVEELKKERFLSGIVWNKEKRAINKRQRRKRLLFYTASLREVLF